MVERGEICRLSKLHAQFFHQLAEIMKISEMSGVEVFLVGDHAPPILDRSEFSANLIGGVVPFIHLRIK